MTDNNADQVKYWNYVAGAKWVANQERLDRLMAPLTESLLTGAAVKPGEHALDIGCGCGDLALRLASAVGPQGRVTAVDISQPMLAQAESRATALPAAGRAPIDWRLVDAMTHDFATSADLVISRFGVMFFDDRPRAFRNLHRALRPGGRFAFLAWRRRSEVEWMQAPLEWIADAIPTPDDVPGEIGPFGLADAAATRQMLEEAGFRNLSVQSIDCPLTIGATVDEAFLLLSEAGPTSAALRDAEPAQQREAARLLRERLDDRRSDGGILLDGACWLYRGLA